MLEYSGSSFARMKRRGTVCRCYLHCAMHLPTQTDSVEMLHQEKRAVVEDIIRRVPDVDTHSGYITFGKAFVSDTAHRVISGLTRLIDDNR